MNIESKAAYENDNSPGVESASKPIAPDDSDFRIARHFCNNRYICYNQKSAETLRFVARHTANEPLAREHRMRALRLISIISEKLGKISEKLGWIEVPDKA
jgi:hypothetical protein